MRILHVVPCADQANGVYHVACMLARKQLTEGNETSVVTARDFVSRFPASDIGPVAAYAEIWIHGMWLPSEWRACWTVIRNRWASNDAKRHRGTTRLVRMTHGSLSPVYLKKQGRWKKLAVSPIERFLFLMADRVVTTGEWETEWCRRWGLKNKIETVDVKQFFDLTKQIVEPNPCPGNPLKVMYLGHYHPLKGIRYLEQAVAELNDECVTKVHGNDRHCIELHVVSETCGEALETEWRWADILCLPTLSENFGLVVAEALERGKPVITTDGAPAWADLEPPQGCFLMGFRDGADEERVKLLKDALIEFVGRRFQWEDNA